MVPFRRVSICLLLAAPLALSSLAQNKPKDDDDSKHHPIAASDVKNPILWHSPGNISDEDLFYGQGGKKGQPVAPFTFLEEDRNQSTPKFDIRDAREKKWRVKLGHEARPEVVASRFLWAVGYFANDDYVLPQADVSGLKMHRGKKYVHGEHVEDVRFARKPGGQKKIATWEWKHNAFTGTRELNGLRVMMALLNSWDLKDENNAVYSDEKSGRQIFLVSDIGTSFGTSGLHFTNAPSKDNSRNYAKSKFITKTTQTTVSFATPGRANSLELETLGAATKQWIRRQHMLWIGRDIPRQDARWIGSLLAQLSHQQLVDAFRAGNYPQEDIDRFVPEVEKRIAALNKL